MNGDSVNSSPIRVGSFTSSEIVQLTKKAKDGSFGAPALTYIKETNRERKLGRSITNDFSSQETDWGKVCEGYVHGNIKYLGTEWEFCGEDTVPHPEIDFWAGSPDLISHRTPRKVGDIKSPFSLSSFCDFADCKTIEDVREYHKDGDKYYFQLISNACIMDCNHAELIIFVPYKHELDTIRDRAREMGYDRIAWKKNDMELPYLIPGISKYPNILKFPFEVTQAMKSELTEIVKLAGTHLIER